MQHTVNRARVSIALYLWDATYFSTSFCHSFRCRPLCRPRLLEVCSMDWVHLADGERLTNLALQDRWMHRHLRGLEEHR